MNYKHLEDEAKRKKESVYFNEEEKQRIIDACKITNDKFSAFVRDNSLAKAEEILEGSVE